MSLVHCQIRSSPERVLIRFECIKQPLCFPNISFLTTSYHIIGKRVFYIPFVFPLSHKGSTLELYHQEKFKDSKVLSTDLISSLINVDSISNGTEICFFLWRKFWIGFILVKWKPVTALILLKSSVKWSAWSS